MLYQKYVGYNLMHVHVIKNLKKFLVSLQLGNFLEKKNLMFNLTVFTLVKSRKKPVARGTREIALY